MRHLRPFRSSTALPIDVLSIALIILVFGVPLFLGLGRGDMRNDEAIYSYAVQRIIETDDWMLPRTIPDDYPFLEKPPLKFWMVAAPIAAGVLPLDEFGLRALDALFGALSFVYVFLLGRALGGAVCGGTAVLVLFSLPSLVFVHGLRSNNMEASLLLAYSGGLYHFARWLQSLPAPASSRVSAWHAAAVTTYFVLGFMTKFVAAFFLPVICGLTLLFVPGGLRRLGSAWRDWVWPVLAAVAISAPRFIYQTQQFGAYFWHIILGAHVLTRMTSYLDPQHLNPWNAYFVWTWRDFSMAGASWLGVAGLARLAASAWTGTPPLTRMILLWWVLPFTLISLGTSKIFHYAIDDYHRVLERMTRPNRPLSVAGECAANVRRSGAAVGEGFYNAAALVADHPYYYYLRQVGPWLLADRPVDDQLRQRLFVAGEQTPIVLSRKDYELLTVRVAALWTDLHGDTAGRPPLTGVAGEERAVVLLPGPYAACVAPAVEAGGEKVGDNPQRRSPWR